MPFLVFFSVVATLLIGGAIIKAIQLYGRGARIRRAHVNWWDDFLRYAKNLVDAHGALADAEIVLAEHHAKMPKEYAAAARAILARSEAFKALHATSAAEAARIADAATSKPEKAPESGERAKTTSATLPSMIWVGDQLVAAPKAA